MMTDKIRRFIADNKPPTPCLVMDLDVVAAKYRELKAAMPLAHIYYAVKANPAHPILTTLVGLKSRFDAASFAEIEQCLAAGAQAREISFGHTVKKESEIAAAHKAGVELFAFDSAEELDKLARSAPGSRVFCRILVENIGAEWPLARKFGCSVEMAVDLMVKAGQMGLVPHGISFHVGSQQTDAGQWEVAIAKTAMIFTDLRRRGVEIKMINLGGGFPARYRDPVPEIDVYADTIMKAMTKHFGNDLPEMIVEPGRGLVGEAGLLVSETVLVATKSYTEDARWVFLDVGKFGGLAETMDEAIKYRLTTPHDGQADGPVKIAGPTCDGVDILYEKTPYRMPLALKAGDPVHIHSAGAYTTMYASIGFNGFGPMKEFFV